MGARKSSNVTWLFDEIGKPLFTDQTLLSAKYWLTVEGTRALAPNERLIRNAKSWSEIVWGTEMPVGQLISTIFDKYSPEGAQVLVPELFTYWETSMLDLPTSPSLYRGLKSFSKVSSELLSDHVSLPIRTLMEHGLSWKEVFELSHLMIWLAFAELRDDVGKLRRGDLELWIDDFGKILKYRLASKNDLTWEVLRGRFELGAEKITLDGGGERLGLTRERVRQIEKKARAIIGSTPLAGPEMLEDLPDDWSGLADILAGWTEDGLKNLAFLTGRGADIGFADTAFSKSVVEDLKDKKISSIIRKSLGGSGFVNLKELGFSLQAAGALSANEPLEAFGAVYDVAAHSGDWVFVTHHGKPKQGYSAILNQLLLGTPLSAEEIYRGLGRRLRSRSKTSEIPPFSAFESFLNQIPALKPQGTLFVTTEESSENHDGHLGWLIGRVGGSDSGCVLVEEVAIEGARLGYRPSTTVQYLQQLEQFRVQNNVAWLVSCPPNKDSLDVASRRAEILEEPTALEFSHVVEGNKTVLRLLFGTVLVRSAQVLVPPTLRPLLSSARRRMNCTCGEASDAELGLTNSNQLAGASWIRNHLLMHPGGARAGIGSSVTLTIGLTEAEIHLEADR